MENPVNEGNHMVAFYGQSRKRLIKVSYKSNAISLCEIGDLVIIGVYLTSNGSDNQRKLKHHEELTELRTICDILSESNKTIMIIGDFNSDPSRDTQWDNQFKIAMNGHNITSHMNQLSFLGTRSKLIFQQD